MCSKDSTKGHIFVSFYIRPPSKCMARYPPSRCPSSFRYHGPSRLLLHWRQSHCDSDLVQGECVLYVGIGAYVWSTHSSLCNFLPSCCRMEGQSTMHWGRRPLSGVWLENWSWFWRQVTTWPPSAVMPQIKQRKPFLPRLSSRFTVS